MTFSCKSIYATLVFFGLMVCVFSSCSEQKRTFVRNYPKDTAFIFNTDVQVKGNLPKDQKNALTLALPTYWDDSLAIRKTQVFGFFYKLRNPPTFDSLAIHRSIVQMNSYLNSQGYYHATFDSSFVIKKSGKQQRAFVTIKAYPGKNLVVDSVTYKLSDSTLQKLAMANTKESQLVTGAAYSKQLISNELDRLVILFRNNGYLKFTRDNLYAEVDTVNKALLELTLDPFEQARKIEEAAEKRKKNPIIDVSIQLRFQSDSVYTDSTVELDSSAMRQYYIGNVYYYPETKITDIPDSLISHPPAYQAVVRRDFTMYQFEGKFKPRPLREHTYLKRGALYHEDSYYNTITNLSNIGAWSQVDGRTRTRGDSVDVHFFLAPAIKQNFTSNLEASYNTGDIITSNSLVGIAADLSLRNRNVWKRAVQSTTTFRNTVELSFNQNRVLQTFQPSLGQVYSFPRIIVPRIPLFKSWFQNDAIKTTNLSVYGSYTDRFDFFRLRQLVASWGYEWKRKNKAWQYKPLNIELYSLDTLRGLDSAFKTNPYLRTAFNTGSVISQIFSYNVRYKGTRHTSTTHYVRFGIEEAGSLLGRIKSLQNRIYQFIRVEGEYSRTMLLKRNVLALRAFAGAGYNYSNDPKFGKTLPFFKQFIAGGPNSMRAWGLRQLGLGSSLLSDTSGAFRDRYGDMQLEVNAEYRYKIATIGGMALNGALFTDVGNIWNLRKDTLNPKGTFEFKNLGKDIAIALGTGLRFDFSYFLIRLDFGIKLKDPARLENGGWMRLSDFTWRNKEFTVYDATDPNHTRIINRNNYAFQLGIGLPF
ncbi:BamA/TamA family outer membrane protein [Deminuibacter soli]|uniref:Bacterial surface antigen (D15) domain-containing protein n=1 Tax=Deminuibacter soli TaxID=2291815 RepID=A0A3E1NM07_9BACT|nr:BamA/TamA family outer membrane protein [Deminuibacter soli]RFM28970.1 hypothetical protein DXN05_09405 [Deminuibacter soli]